MSRVLVCVGAALSLALGALQQPATATGQTASRPSLGEVRNGRYYHRKTGINLAVPAGWAILSDGHSSDGGEMVTLGDSVSDSMLHVWMIVAATSQEASASAGPADWFRHVIGMKIRHRFDQGLRDYWVSADSIQEKTIGSRPALAAIGEFTQAGQRATECLTWIAGEKTWAFFFDQTTTPQLSAVRARFDEIVGTAVVP